MAHPKALSGPAPELERAILRALEGSSTEKSMGETLRDVLRKRIAPVSPDEFRAAAAYLVEHGVLELTDDLHLRLSKSGK